MTGLAKVDVSSAGCWIDGHWGQYAIIQLVSLAIEHGWRLEAEDDAIFTRLFLSTALTANEASNEDWVALHEQGGLADQAENWLNEHIAPDDYFFGWHDGEFFLWPLHVWHEDDPTSCDCTPEQIEAAGRFL